MISETFFRGTWSGGAINGPPLGGVRNREIAKIGNHDFHKNVEISQNFNLVPTFSWNTMKPVFTGNPLPGPEMHGNHYHYKGILEPRAGPKVQNPDFHGIS